MRAVNVRELARNTSRVIDDVERSKRPALITRSGRPVAAVVPINLDALEDWILASAPVFVKGRRQADKEFRLGETISMGEVFARLERRSATKTPAAKRSDRAVAGNR
jgi:prevent-host-death family protein